MTHRQTCSFQMLLRTLDFLRSAGQTGAVRGLPAFVARLGAEVAQLNTLGQAQSRATEGARLHRDAVLADLRDTALGIAGIVAVYALEYRRLHLLPLVNATPTAFNLARLEQKTWLAWRIADAAESVLPEIEPFGVTPGMVAELRVKIGDAREVLHTPRTAILQRQSTTRQIASMLRAAAVTLAQIDRLLFPLRRSDPQFHADYRAARRVLGRRRGRIDHVDADIARAGDAALAGAAERESGFNRTLLAQSASEKLASGRAGPPGRP